LIVDTAEPTDVAFHSRYCSADVTPVCVTLKALTPCAGCVLSNVIDPFASELTTSKAFASCPPVLPGDATVPLDCASALLSSGSEAPPERVGTIVPPSM
jgi:hypothetical protein